MICPVAYSACNMDFADWSILTIFGGSFVAGFWFLMIRKDDRFQRTRTIHPGTTKSRGSPDFSKARSEFDRKLAEVNRYLAAKKLAEEGMEEDEGEKSRKAAEDNASRLAEIEEENKAKAEEDANKAAEIEEARRSAQKREEERQAEEARLAAEREARRQEEMAASETERVEEINNQETAQELASKEASDSAIKELRERLEREGAKSSDVQISLLWNNYNDLDLHVVCPSGERIHGGNRTSNCHGELDVDANVRPETKKPVENVVWPEGKAPGGTYRVYVHHYKKHKKRRARDPTEFKVICNGGGIVKEYQSALTFGDPIMLVCEFTVDSPEERAKSAVDAQLKLEAMERGELDVEEALEGVETEDEINPGTFIQSDVSDALDQHMAEEPGEFSDAIDTLLSDEVEEVEEEEEMDLLSTLMDEEE